MNHMEAFWINTLFPPLTSLALPIICNWVGKLIVGMSNILQLQEKQIILCLKIGNCFLPLIDS